MIGRSPPVFGAPPNLSRPPPPPLQGRQAMTDNPQDILRSVARIPEGDRHAQKDEILGKYSTKLVTPLHRQILECLVGEHCTSLAAKSWATTLVREASGGEPDES